MYQAESFNLFLQLHPHWEKGQNWGLVSAANHYDVDDVCSSVIVIKICFNDFIIIALVWSVSWHKNLNCSISIINVGYTFQHLPLSQGTTSKSWLSNDRIKIFQHWSPASTSYYTEKIRELPVWNFSVIFGFTGSYHLLLDLVILLLRGRPMDSGFLLNI